MYKIDNKHNENERKLKPGNSEQFITKPKLCKLQHTALNVTLYKLLPLGP